tara:strand:+ start:1485 stop:2441 length:957 start_codon:yes stop_codon:yes gene_type:complete
MKNNSPLYIGVLTFVTIVSFILGFLYLQDISINKSKFTFTVIFDSVQGLNDGDNVSMLGKRLGKVSKIKFMGQKIAVELSIDDEFNFNIPIDSEIEVKSEGLLGEKYVSINPGKSTNEFISAGETVAGKREYDFSEITPGIIPMTQDLGVFARRLKATLNEAQKNNIQNTLRNVESLTSNIDSISYAIENAISEKESNDIKNMIENLSQSGQELREISQLVNTKVKEDLEKIDIFLEKLVVFSESSNEIIKSFEVSALKIDSVLNKLNNGNGTAALLLNDNSIYLSLDSLIKDARNVVTDFNDNPGKYIKAYFKSKKK